MVLSICIFTYYAYKTLFLIVNKWFLINKIIIRANVLRKDREKKSFAQYFIDSKSRISHLRILGMTYIWTNLETSKFLYLNWIKIIMVRKDILLISVFLTIS